MQLGPGRRERRRRRGRRKKKKKGEKISLPFPRFASFA